MAFVSFGGAGVELGFTSCLKSVDNGVRHPTMSNLFRVEGSQRTSHAKILVRQTGSSQLVIRNLVWMAGEPALPKPLLLFRFGEIMLLVLVVPVWSRNCRSSSTSIQCRQ
jgi:hypothetical protein